MANSSRHYIIVDVALEIMLRVNNLVALLTRDFVLLPLATYEYASILDLAFTILLFAQLACKNVMLFKLMRS